MTTTRHYDTDASHPTTIEARTGSGLPGSNADARPETVTFDCSQCGECCSSITIHIETEKAKALQEKPWFQERLREFGKTLMPYTREHWLIPHKPDQTCVFLGDTKECLIETHEGKNAKPSECRNFPFAAVTLPDGRKLFDCSASCKHVAEDLIGLFRRILPESSWAKTLPAQEAPKQVRVSIRQRISWDEFLERQHHLNRRLESDDIMLAELPQQAKSILLNRPVKRGLPSWLSQGKHLILLACFLRKPYGSLSFIQLFQKQSYLDNFVFGNIPLHGILRAKQTPVLWTSESQRLLKAFAANILNRYVLLSHGHWVVNLIAISESALVIATYYATTLAILQSEEEIPTVSSVQMAQAIRLTERYYTGHQPRFLASFRQRFLGLPLGWWLA